MRVAERRKEEEGRKRTESGLINTASGEGRAVNGREQWGRAVKETVKRAVKGRGAVKKVKEREGGRAVIAEPALPQNPRAGSPGGSPPRPVVPASPGFSGQPYSFLLSRTSMPPLTCLSCPVPRLRLATLQSSPRISLANAFPRHPGRQLRTGLAKWLGCVAMERRQAMRLVIPDVQALLVYSFCHSA